MKKYLMKMQVYKIELKKLYYPIAKYYTLEAFFVNQVRKWMLTFLARFPVSMSIANNKFSASFYKGGICHPKIKVSIFSISPIRCKVEKNVFKNYVSNKIFFYLNLLSPKFHYNKKSKIFWRFHSSRGFFGNLNNNH